LNPDLPLRRGLLYPFNYGGAGKMVERKGIEPSTFALRTRRSPN
jgi:hypothetical protein